MDKLKQYLQEHRQEMDVEIPPVDLLTYIQAGAVAPAANAVLIKYLIGIGILAIVGTSAWWMMQQQKAVQPSAPSMTPKEVIQKDTVPVQKDTLSAQPVIKHKKIRSAPPTPPVMHKHKIKVDTVNHEPQPRIKKNVDSTVHPPLLRIKKSNNTTDHPTPPRIKKKGPLPIT